MTSLPRSDQDRSLINIYDLLEKEGHISYELLAQSLGTSRMTAYRTAAKLIEQNKLCERHGIDPRTKRHMKLLSLAPMPPCLILDMHPNTQEMSAFYAKGTHIHTLSCAYHTTYGETHGTDLNIRRLLDMVAILWPDAIQAPRMVWDARDNKVDQAETPHIPGPTKRQALTYALTHHPHLPDKTGVLFLHMGDLPFGTYMERTSPDAPWQNPSQDHALTQNLHLLGWQSMLPQKEKRALLAKYLNHIHRMGLLSCPPRLIILEEDMAASDKISQSAMRFDVVGKGDEIPVYRHLSPTPWWIYGGFWQYRREMFLAPVQEKELEMQR